MPLDWLVVGAGFTGATFARAVAERGRKVLVVDARPHVGGNAYDRHDDHGLLVHVYGPHIFHTHSEEVWRFLSGHTEWRPYEHRVLATVDDQWVPLPFNLDSIDRLFPRSVAEGLTDTLVRTYGFGARVPILKLKESEDEQVRSLAGYVYERVFLDYTRKQWGMPPEALDPSVTARVPVLLSRDDRYFHDTFQAMPSAGYTALFERMLDHRNIEVRLGVPFEEVGGGVKAERVLYTGRIDAYFGYRFGRLPYRSLRFDFETLKQERFQQVATHNYPGTGDFTRITEMKQLTGQAHPALTTICTEYPVEHVDGVNDPYYPVPRADNRALYRRYADAAAAEAGHVVFAGRLGDYQYYNMDQAVARALMLAREHG